jgi:ATP-binding cassette subfamily C (CFTR/MRP) protein 4
MTSFERVKEYLTIESENVTKGVKKVALDWPTAGEVTFENVSFRYDQELPLVLDDLAFKIYPGEKIGIVGRTGAGKSSIIQAIYRIAEPEGSIIIDGVNTKDISLHDLRTKIAIIPVRACLQIISI